MYEIPLPIRMGQFTFNNKNVVLLIKVAVLGGAERQALGLAKYLTLTYNCRVSLVATHSNIPTIEFMEFAKECGIENIEYFGIPSLTIKKGFSIHNLKKIVRAFIYLYKMKKGIAKFKPDILIPFLNTPSKIAALIYKSVGAKITFWHQLGLDNYSYDFLEKQAIKKVPFIIANAANGLEIFKEKYTVTSEKLFVLPQYVSIKKIELDKLTLKKEFLIKSDALVIGMVAHYREEKFQELLIRAFSKIKTSKQIHLVLLGNKGNDEHTQLKYKQLLELVQNKGINERVSVLSNHPVEKILNILDIGVLISQIEGTPNVVMEYMLYGLPIVASNHIGCKKLLENSPYLIPNNEVVLTEQLEQLINNKALRKEEGDLNENRIKKYSIDNYIKKLTSIINSFYK
jgi:glycosyltransferase involved in cell wall biosynthesis